MRDERAFLFFLFVFILVCFLEVLHIFSCSHNFINFCNVSGVFSIYLTSHATCMWSCIHRSVLQFYASN